MLKSIVRRICEPCNDLPVPPLLQRIYTAREVRFPHELQRELRLLASPAALLNMRRQSLCCTLRCASAGAS